MLITLIFHVHPAKKIKCFWHPLFNYSGLKWSDCLFWILNHKIFEVCMLCCSIFRNLNDHICHLHSLNRNLQKFFVSTMRNLERLQSKVRSPIFSFFSETLNGTAVVRAYGAQERFIKEFQRRFDLCMSVELDWGNCNRWAYMVHSFFAFAGDAGLGPGSCF